MPITVHWNGSARPVTPGPLNSASVIEINGNTYRICLLDTNALSELRLNFADWFSYLENHYPEPPIVISVSVFTLMELQARTELFDKYLDIFSVLPSAVLDGHESIFAKEVENYRNDSEINPIVFAPSVLKQDGLGPL